MQLRNGAFQDDEARARQLRGGVEIDEAELLADRHVIERLERELGRSAPAAQFHVGVGVGACRDGFVQHVRQAGEEIVELCGKRSEPCFAGAELVAERSDFALQRFDVAAGSLGATDRFRALVASLAQAFDTRLKLLALRLERKITLAVELETASCEVRRHGLEVLAQELGIEHRASLANAARRADTSRRAAAMSTQDQPRRRRRSWRCLSARMTSYPSAAAAGRG